MPLSKDSSSASSIKILLDSNRSLIRLSQWLLTSIHCPRIQKLGFVYAFFVFLPVVGDVFALALGLARYHQWLALLGIALGKLARYSVLIMPLVGF